MLFSDCSWHQPLCNRCCSAMWQHRMRWHAEQCAAAARAQSTKFMLGIIIAVIASNWVGEAIHSDGIYETDLEADGSVIFLRPSPPQALASKRAADIASRAVWCFREVRLHAGSLRMCWGNGRYVHAGAYMQAVM